MNGEAPQKFGQVVHRPESERVVLVPYFLSAGCEKNFIAVAANRPFEVPCEIYLSEVQSSSDMRLFGSYGYFYAC